MIRRMRIYSTRSNCSGMRFKCCALRFQCYVMVFVLKYMRLTATLILAWITKESVLTQLPAIRDNLKGRLAGDLVAANISCREQVYVNCLKKNPSTLVDTDLSRKFVSANHFISGNLRNKVVVKSWFTLVRQLGNYYLKRATNNKEIFYACFFCIFFLYRIT